MIKKISSIYDKSIHIALVISIALMLSLTCLNIVLRWFQQNIMWIDPFVRHLVFLSAFLGGALATANDSHIRIDLAGKLLESKGSPKIKVWIDRVLNIICLIALCYLAQASIEFLKTEIEFGKKTFLHIHTSVLVGIIPFGLGLIGLRFILRLLETFTKDES